VDASGRDLTVMDDAEAARVGRDVFALPEERVEELVAALAARC
jgi:hypothetical protein